MVTSTIRRPIGATLIAAALFWLSVGALGALVFLNPDSIASSFPPSSPAANLAASLRSPLFKILLLCYGASALVAGLGIWRMRSWGSSTFLVWSSAAVSLGGLFIWAAPSEIILGGKAAGITFTVFVSVMLGLIYRYLDRAVTSRSQAAL